MGDAEGVLVSMGGVAGGYTLFVQHGRLIYDYNFFREHSVITSGAVLDASARVIEFRFSSDTSDLGSGGLGRLLGSGVEVGSGRVNRTVPFRYSVGGTFDVGCETVTPVSPMYQSPFAFTGRIRNVTVDISGIDVDDPATAHNPAQSIQ
ncbi:hypothetical protein [Rhodococcus sp. IEGM 1379]|uniref:hypothetical protein n=1 Tax=Rhodococcus sp. IEGM 1379 TaxID=3047086 RepID=UPI0024B6EED8|nr:hypothetical protein [Rhodococcus sp. IEGM 1379]MDI9916566.1 hypothetical protein [Rhodococcus sp. IEGM 1379]